MSRNDPVLHILFSMMQIGKRSQNKVRKQGTEKPGNNYIRTYQQRMCLLDGRRDRAADVLTYCDCSMVVEIEQLTCLRSRIAGTNIGCDCSMLLKMEQRTCLRCMIAKTKNGCDCSMVVKITAADVTNSMHR